MAFEVGKLPELLSGVGKLSSKQIIGDFSKLSKADGTLKAAGLKLGESLAKVKKQLKKQKKWLPLVDEIARLTGYSTRTIRRWADGDNTSTQKPTVATRKPHNREQEIKAFCKRLNAGADSLITDATDVVREMAAAIGVQVTVTIEMI